LPKTATIVDRMSRKLLTKTGAAVYAARKGIVEPVIGQISMPVASAHSCCGDSRRCKVNGRWSARRTIFSSGIASVCERMQDALVRLGAPDTHAAIAESADGHLGAQHEVM
jgi:hypothetical protein